VFAFIGSFDTFTDNDSGSVQDEGTLTIGVRDDGGVGQDETDRWRLVGREGEFRVSVTAEGDFDPVVEVHESDGDSIGRDDDSGGGRNSQLDVSLERGETYRVEVTGFGSSSGDYHVLVQPLAEAEAEEDAETTVPDLPPVDGGSLTQGQAATGSVPAGGAVRYRFVGEGGAVTISVDGLDGFDPTVTVLTSDGGQLGFDDDGGEEQFDSLLELDVAAGQTVFVEVGGFGGQAGRYEVEVQ
jgi:hypothetical protein